MSFVSSTQQENTPSWQSFLDIDEDVKPYLQIDPNNTDFDPALGSITRAACTWVQNYLNRPIAPTRFFRRFDGWTGWGGSHVMLQWVPVLQIVSVVEYWGSSGPHTLTEQTPERQGTGDMFQVDPQTGQITRTFMGLIERPFFPGIRNIEVTWIAGFNPVPEDVKLATKELVNWWWRNTQEAPRWFQRAQYDEGGASPMWPAIPNRVTAMLEAYSTFTVA